MLLIQCLKMQRKGFTLIELLVVIGIIGIFAAVAVSSYGSYRKSARDDRRIGDLRATAQALQLFFLRCGFYPGGFDASLGKCIGGQKNGNEPAENPGDWDELEKTLAASEVGAPSIQNDPDFNSYGKTYDYFVQLGDVAANTPRAQCYVLRAVLETDHPALKKDLDNAELIEKLAPASCLGLSCKKLYPGVSIDCDEAGGKFNYCIGNQECFYGL